MFDKWLCYIAKYRNLRIFEIQTTNKNSNFKEITIMTNIRLRDIEGYENFKQSAISSLRRRVSRLDWNENTSSFPNCSEEVLMAKSHW